MRLRALWLIAILSSPIGIPILSGGDAVAQCIRPPAGLTGWWPGDGDGRDSAGGLDALFHGDATTGAGFVDGAFRLDGDGDFVSVPDAPALDVGSGDFTVDLWVRFNAVAGEQVVIEKYVERDGTNTPSLGWTLTKTDSATLRLQLGSTLGIDADDLDFGGAETWTHLAARRHGNEFTIFVDGVAEASDVADVDLSSPSSLKFGHRGSPTDTPGSTDVRGFFLNGSIDEVELFVGRALADQEIRALFRAGRAGKCKGEVAEVPAVSPLGGLLTALSLATLMLYVRRRAAAPPTPPALG